MSKLVLRALVICLFALIKGQLMHQLLHLKERSDLQEKFGLAVDERAGNSNLEFFLVLCGSSVKPNEPPLQ